MNQLDLNLIVLLILLACGVLSQNHTISIATMILIIIKLLPIGQTIFPYMQQYGLNIGILILTIAVLTPIASGKISGEVILKSFVNVQSLIAIAIGVLVAWLGGRGVGLMTTQPNIVVGLLIGTVAGVAFLRGVPVAPLVAAGILSLFYLDKQ